MTVEQLKKKLNRMPDDAKIVFTNTDDVVNAIYVADNAIYNDSDHVVEIISNYTKVIDYL